MASIKDVPSILSYAYECKQNVALCSAHGRGKTSVVSQYAEENGFDYFRTIILTNMTPEDFVGLPVTKVVDGDTVTTFSCPDWLAKASDGKSKCLLFFDEFTNAECDVQAAILSLIESRESNGHVLNENTQIVMAFNPPEIAPNATPLSPATRDRICVIPLTDEDSRDSYVKYFSDKGNGALALFAGINNAIRSYDSEVIEEAYNNATLTYRSAEKISDLYNVIHSSDKNIFYCMAEGFSGSAGLNFAKYLNSADGIASLTEVYQKKGAKALMKALVDNRDVIESYCDAPAFARYIRSIVDNDRDWATVAKCFDKEALRAI